MNCRPLCSDMLTDLIDEVMDDDTCLTDMSDAPGSEDSDIEIRDEPKRFLRPRRGGILGEPIESGYYKEPFWNKQESWDLLLYKWLSREPCFANLTRSGIQKLVRSMSTHLFYEGEQIAQQSERADALFVVLEGTVDCYQMEGGVRKPKFATSITTGAFVDQTAVVWSTPRRYSLYARDECILAKLSRIHYANLVVRDAVYRWWGRQSFLRGASLLEMMEDEQIAKLVDVLKVKTYEAGEMIIKQNDEGNVFFIMETGEAKVWVTTGSDDVQEYRRYHRGDLFGELALLKNAARAANVTAVTRVVALALSRGQFERLLGPIAQLHQQQYLTDPRKLIADFYGPSDCRGPRGTLHLSGREPDVNKPPSSWFVVYRPTSRDAIAKMLSGTAVGKGLNIKGKSAKQGVLSGYVPFAQISDNKHKAVIEQSPSSARLLIYYKSKSAREEARKKLEAVMKSAVELKIQVRRIDLVDDYAPKVFGLQLPEPLVREAYLMRADLSPVMGWETGRRSEPAFMDMNMHAVRNPSEPKVVLYQYDESDSMNPRGLLIAYAEKFVKPVVSDFDTFLVASKGMEYDSLPLEQTKMVTWLLQQAENIIKSPDHNPWTSRWLEVLKQENAKGYHPTLPKYGYGDPTSYRLIGDIVAETSPCGAVRHGAECFNFYFPQELDDEYLVIWEGFPDKPWEYKHEELLRAFLVDRIKEGFAFPLNPVWPVRDGGWYELLQALLKSGPALPCLKAWYPKDSGILERIDELHWRYPQGYVQGGEMMQAPKGSNAGMKASQVERHKGRTLFRFSGNAIANTFSPRR